MSTAPPSSELSARIGHEFVDPALLDLALAHRSWAHDHSPSLPDNERLEFLGDAVLGLLIAEFFVEAFLDVDEGRLTRARAMVVRADSLSRYARALDLGAFLRLGRGEVETGGREKDSILADAFEAVIGAIYQDAGLEAARGFLHRTMAGDLARRDPDGGPWSPRNPRTELQETLQRSRRGTPSYRVVARSGLDHDPSWEVEVCIGESVLGLGTGSSKKDAYEEAAVAALAALEQET
jgi:ribonuclease III